MAKHGRGLLCLAMTPERLDELEIPLEVADELVAPRHGVLRVDRREGRHDDRHLGAGSRARRFRWRSRPRPSRAIWRGPATCFRCARATGGVLVRAGHTEAAVDLARIAGLHAGRRHLRSHERRRHDGARAGADEVRAQARPADDHDRGSDPLSDADREPREARRRRRRCRPSTDRSGSTSTRACIDGETHVALVRGDIGDGTNVHGARALEVPDRRRVPFDCAATAARSSTRR